MSKELYQWRAGVTLAAFIVASDVGVALAQDDSAEAEETGTMEVVQVTARKKEESILEAPVAITAFSRQRIEILGLEDIRDLPGFTPGFVYEDFAGVPGRFDNSPRFRGVSVNTLSPTRQTASVFVDGIFVAGGVQGISLNDVERVEIIKGPQSAFFGRNTFGGAVNYITRTPGDEFAADISATVATRDEYEAVGGIEGPILGDVVKARLSGSYRDEGGHYRNSVNDEELGRERTWSITGTLFFDFSENFSGRVRVNYFENEDDQAAYSFSGVTEHNCGPFGGTDTTICGDVMLNQPGANTEQTQAFFDALNNLTALNGSHRDEFGLDRQSVRVSGQFDYSFPNSDITLSALTGYNHEEVNLIRDADDTADNAFLSYAGRQFEDFSQELRLTGTALSGALDWSIGGNYFDQRFTNNGEFLVPPLGFFAFGSGEPAEENIETFGVFGSLAYAVTDKIRLTFEGRYQVDEVAEDDDITDMTPAASGKFKNFLPRAIADFQVTQDTLLYFSFSEGNLPGGFNGEVAGLTPDQLAELQSIEPGASETFDEEILRNYEIGAKHGFDDGRGFITFAAFFMKRTGQTVRRSDLISDPTSMTGTDQIDYFINIGQSDIYGFEFEGTYRVSSFFTIEGTLAYLDSTIKEFETGVFNEVFGTPDASGQRSERFPKWSGSLSGMFEGNFANGWSWFGRVDSFYTGRRFADELNLTSAADGIEVNLRAGVQTERFRVELFVTNVTNSDVPTAINRFRDLSFATPLFDFSTFGYQVGLRDLRQFGARLSADF